MSIGDEPLRRAFSNRATITAVLLSVLLVVVAFGALPAAGGDTVGASESPDLADGEDQTSPATVQDRTPDKEFSGGNSVGDLVLDTETGSVGYDVGQVSLSGTIYENGDWEGSAEFSDEVKTLNGVDVRIDSASGVSGTYDPASDTFTLSGTFELVVVDTGESATFDVSASTDQNEKSNSLDSDPIVVSVGPDEVSVTDSTISDSTENDLGIGDSATLAPFFQLNELELDVTEFAAVSGTVTDESGDPIEGATVEVGDQSATTDSTGDYSIAAVETGSQPYSVSVDGYENTDGTVTVEEGGTTLDESLQALYTVSGQVTDTNGNGLDGATVTVGGESTTTDGNGNFAVGNLGTGEYEVTADASGYDARSRTINVEGDVEESFQLERNVADVSLSISGGTYFGSDPPRITATVEHVGDEPGVVDAELAFAQKVLTTKQTIMSPGETIQLSGKYRGFPFDAGQDFVAAIRANGQESTATITLKEAGDVGTTAQTFTATNTGEGYIAFDEPDRETAVSEGVKFPGGEIQINGNVDSQGNWESTKVDFPTLTTPTGLTTSVGTPQGLFGTIDREGGSLSANGPLVVTVQQGDNPSFRFNIQGTTGSSGALSGEANFEGGSGEVLLVDNEFTIPDETGNPIIDPALGLPLEQPGKAWLELGLDLQFGEFEQTTGGVTGTVTDEAGEPIEGATVSVGSSQVQTGSDGAFTLEGVPTGTQELSVEADGYVAESVELDVTEGNATETTVELTAGSAEFALQVESASISAGETGTATAIVENVGTAGGETTVSFGADGLFDVEETVSVPAGETAEVTAEVSTTEDDVGEYTAVASAGEQRAEGTISVTSGSDSGPSGDVRSGFRATNTGDGFISFDVTQGVQTAREEGLAFPGDEIEIEGVLYEDGTWESTGVSFPNLEVQTGIEGSVTVPNGFTGEYDLEDDYLSAEAKLEVEIIAQGQSQGAFEFTVNTDTGESNGPASEAGLQGSASFENGELPGSVTLVDNEYVADDTTGSSIVDPVLGLPITEPGRNWLELHLELEPAEAPGGGDSGTIAGTVTDEAGEPIEGATVTADGSSATTGADGSYELGGVATGSQTVTASADGYAEGSATVDVTSGETTEQAFSLESGSPSITVEMSISEAAPGETVTAEATVTNEGTAEGSETITFSFGEETRTEDVTLGPGESTTITTEWTPEEAGEYEVGASVGGEMVAQQSVSVQEDNGSQQEAEGDFIATSTGGFVGFGYDSESAAREEGVTLPEGVQIVGEINEEEGTWESTDTFFPTFQANGLDVDISAPNGVSGRVDFEEGLLTQRGMLRVTVAGEATFEYTINATTRQSGALSGSASVDQEAGNGTLTLVDNQYVIEDQTDNSVVNSALSLPSPESGSNWYELSFEVSLEGGTIDEPANNQTEQSGSGNSLIRSAGLVGGALALAGALILLAVIAFGRFAGVNLGSE